MEKRLLIEIPTGELVCPELTIVEELANVEDIALSRHVGTSHDTNLQRRKKPQASGSSQPTAGQLTTWAEFQITVTTYRVATVELN